MKVYIGGRFIQVVYVGGSGEVGCSHGKRGRCAVSLTSLFTTWKLMTSLASLSKLAPRLANDLLSQRYSKVLMSHTIDRL